MYSFNPVEQIHATGWNLWLVAVGVIIMLFALIIVLIILNDEHDEFKLGSLLGWPVLFTLIGGFVIFCASPTLAGTMPVNEKVASEYLGITVSTGKNTRTYGQFKLADSSIVILEVTQGEPIQAKPILFRN